MGNTEADLLENRAILAVLEALTRVPRLREHYVLKGGYSLHAVYGSPRQSFDLDLNSAAPTANSISEATNRRLLQFCLDLNTGLEMVCNEDSFLQLHTSNEKLSKELPVLLGEVSYRYHDGRAGDIKMQLMLSEIICQAGWHDVQGVRVLAASLEDILAEKLKAVIQQVTRSSVRSNDIYDVWYFTTSERHRVDPAKTTQFLLEKCKQWSLPPLMKRQFRDEAVIAISESAFEHIENQLTNGAALPTFSEAYGALLAFIDRMDLPE